MNKSVLTTLRINKGLKQEDLGKEIGYTKSGMSLLEKGKRQPKASTIIKLSKLLDCSIETLINHFANLEN